MDFMVCDFEIAMGRRGAVVRVRLQQVYPRQFYEDRGEIVLYFQDGDPRIQRYYDAHRSGQRIMVTFSTETPTARTDDTEVAEP